MLWFIPAAPLGFFSFLLEAWTVACEFPNHYLRQRTCYTCGFGFLWAKSYSPRLESLDYDHTRLLTCLLIAFFQKEWTQKSTPAMAGQKSKVTSPVISPLFCFSLQGRHVKTGQLAAIKVMDVTEVSKCHCGFKSLQKKNRILKYSMSSFLSEPRTDIREVCNLTATSSSPKAWSSWQNFGSGSMVIRCPDTLKRNEHFIKAATENPLIWVDQIVPSVFKDPADFS